MNEEANLLKTLAKAVVFEDYKSRIFKNLTSRRIDWQRLKDLVLYHELAPFLYIIIKNNPEVIPEEFFIFLKNEYYNQIFQYMFLWEEVIKILKEAERSNILIVLIKGFSFSEKYYKRYGFRPLVDIDLVIKEEELDKGVYLLEELGYKKILSKGKEEYWREKQCHLEFINNVFDNPISVDLHWALDFKRGRNDILPSLWQRIKKINIGNIEASTLSLEDTIFSLSLHQRRFGKILNLKYVCDLGLILKDIAILDWDYMLKTAEKEKFKSCLFFLLAQVQIVLDIDLTKYTQKLRIHFWKRKIILRSIKKYTYLSYKDFKIYYLYLLCHFLLYDNIKEPIKFIINIPQEQFAKFYKLPLYESHTKRLYRIRFFYMFYRLIIDGLRKNLL